MADDEDDYLSDKFLVEETPVASTSKSYSQRRKDAEKQAHLKNVQNRTKSRRQLEIESREEGLSKSLFERAQEEEETGSGKNKALSMMMKMGFKPGQSLGTVEEPTQTFVPPTTKGATPDHEFAPSIGHHDSAGQSSRTQSQEPKRGPGQRVEPLPILEWAGKKGIGLGKRAPSPTATERIAKMAKMEEVASHENFRDHARQEYEERRAEGRLRSAQQTCTNLDEKAGKAFNVLWLDPKEEGSFPDGLLDALTDNYDAAAVSSLSFGANADNPTASQLKRQMRADALYDLDQEDNDGRPVSKAIVSRETYSVDTLAEAAQFLRLDARDRLQLVLAYLRNRYAYCFWCGTQYESLEEMNTQCPGEDEDDHN